MPILACWELVQLENSLMLVNFDNARRFGRRRVIHVWWGGLQANGGIMLLTAYLIKAHYRWRDAVVRVLTVVDTEEQKSLAFEGLGRVFESARLKAEPAVL